MIILAFAKQISPGARRHVRRQKARIRREYVHTEEIKVHIVKLYERFGVVRVDKPAPSGKKDHSPRKGRGQTK